MQKVTVTKVSGRRWQKAQAFEVEAIYSIMGAHDDWNKWWKNKFSGYKTLRGKNLPKVLEVGSGPHTNLRLILPHITTKEIYLEDPLIQSYLDFRPGIPPSSRLNRMLGKRPPVAAPIFIQALFKNKSYRVHLTSSPLEELPYQNELVDLVVCINVLDHVFDLGKCMAQMNRVLKKGGILVLGQDLSNEEDYRQYPGSWKDIGHPIKVDQAELEKHLKNYGPLFKKILTRKAGRNPTAHYGTYLLIAKKR